MIVNVICDQVTESIYDLMGSESPSSHKIDQIFFNMDTNRSEVKLECFERKKFNLFKTQVGGKVFSFM